VRLVPVALLLLASPATAVEMPKDLVGSWCVTNSEKYIKCPEVEAWNFLISRDAFGTEHTSCEPLTVNKQGQRTWIIKARCTQNIEGKPTGPSKVKIIRYSRKSTNLYIRGWE
jgi:hypothetical protein